MEKMRGEMRQMGQCLQAGIMATPRAATNELGGSATAVRPAMEAGEVIINGETEMCKTRHEVTTNEKVKETRIMEKEKLEEQWARIIEMGKKIDEKRKEEWERGVETRKEF